MKMTRLLWVSLFVTVVILVVVGGVTASTVSSRSVQAAQAAQADFAAREAEYQAREAEYQKLIQQANQQIEKANSDLQKLAGGAQNTAQSGPAAAPAARPAVALTADKAMQIAGEAVEPGMQPTKKPELVKFEGKTAFEVAYEAGSVYVDAQNGEVLFNGTVPQLITAEQAAQVAADYLHLKGILQTDVVPFRGQQLYRVIFKNGTLAYLDKTGQILYVHPYDPNANQNLNASFDDGGGGGGGGSHHDDDHEEHDD